MRKSRIPVISAIAIGLLAGSTVGVAAQDQTSVRTDILAGVELVTEAVEPGALRIVSDGVRDLTIPIVADDEEGTDPRTSQIAVDKRGRVWVFGPEAFFHLGAAASHEGRAWDSAKVDEEGTIWALLDDGRLEAFAAGEWDLKARRVLDFDLHPDGSVFMFWEEPDGKIDVIGPLRKRDWKDAWTKARGPSRELGEGSIVVRAGHGDGGKDSYRGWLLRNGEVGSWFMNKSMGGSEGPLNDHGEARSMATRPKGGSWLLLRYDGMATLVDGRLTVAPQYWVARGSAEGPEQGNDQWFEVPGMQPDGPTFSDDLAVAPDGSLWLPSDDGLGHFDRKTWTWYLRGHAIDDVDIAADGTVWVQAVDDTTVSTYVIDPEAAMDTE